MPLVAANSSDTPLTKSKYFWKALKRTFVEFCANTSVHGMQYVIDTKGSRCSRIIWFCVVMVSFIFANILVDVFWVRYKANPTRVNVDTNHAPLNEMNFPAVTICNIARMSYERARYVISTMTLADDMTEEEMASLLQLTDGFVDVIEYNVTDLVKLEKYLKMNRYNVPLTMENLMMPCNMLLIKCRFAGEEMDCMELFRQSSTWQGYCCSFNIQNEKLEIPIRKAETHGLEGGLSFAVRPLVEDKTISRIYTDGIKVYIHENSIFPSEAVSEKTLPHNTETFMNILPEVTIASSQIRTIPPESRGCVFPDELKLKFFDEYKRFNCELEFRMDQTFDKCGCQPFYYPEVKDRPICDFNKIPCLVDKYEEIRSDVGLDETCPTQCDQVNYKITANSVNFLKLPGVFNRFYQNLNSSNMIIHIFISRQVYRRFRKDLLSNIILLVSNLGGVYSLFVGMSVLSFIEIFYFFTVRLYKNYKQVMENETRIILVKPKLTDTSLKLIYNRPAPVAMFRAESRNNSNKTITVTGLID